MADTRSDLEDNLWNWLDKGSPELVDTRRLLGPDLTGKRSGLGDGQIANWRRRKRLPDTFVEGAALYHCAQARTGTLDPAARTGIRGDSFWQAFVVAGGDGPKLDCTILRLWTGVRALHDNRPGYLTHVAHRSTDQATEEREPEELGRKHASFERRFEYGGGVFVSWKVGREPRDYGYELEFPNSIVNNSNEAVGGLSVIHVDAVHMLVFLPQRVVERLMDMRIPGNPFGLPGSFSTLLHGDGVQVMESYLGIRRNPGTGDYRRLGPWFRAGPAGQLGAPGPFPATGHRQAPCLRGSDGDRCGRASAVCVPFAS